GEGKASTEAPETKDRDDLQGGVGDERREKPEEHDCWPFDEGSGYPIHDGDGEDEHGQHDAAIDGAGILPKPISPREAAGGNGAQQGRDDDADEAEHQLPGAYIELEVQQPENKRRDGERGEKGRDETDYRGQGAGEPQ